MSIWELDSNYSCFVLNSIFNFIFRFISLIRCIMFNNFYLKLNINVINRSSENIITHDFILHISVIIIIKQMLFKMLVCFYWDCTVCLSVLHLQERNIIVCFEKWEYKTIYTLYINIAVRLRHLICWICIIINFNNFIYENIKNLQRIVVVLTC